MRAFSGSVAVSVGCALLAAWGIGACGNGSTSTSGDASTGSGSGSGPPHGGGSGSGSSNGSGSGSTHGSGTGSTHGSGCGTEPLGGLQISVGLELSASSVSVGQTLTGTATLFNPTSAALTLKAADIAARPPGGTNAGGPFDDLYDGPGVTIGAGQSFVLTGGRPITSADPAGSWYAYVTVEYVTADDASVPFHDSTCDVHFTVTGGGSGTGSSSPPAGTITVDTTTVLATISSRELGTNMNVDTDMTDPRVATAVSAVGAKALRYPGGTWADQFHWQTNTMCANTPQIGALPISANGKFDDFMTNVVNPGGLEAVITVDYGTNAACTGGGDPAEAAAWVAYAKSKNYNAHYWTVGNEVYGSYEPDLHSPANNAATYAAAMAGPNGFYQQMKNADPTAQVGVVLWPGPSDFNGWNAGVLGPKPPLDFVEIHPYAQCGNNSDSYLLQSAPAALTAAIEGTRTTLVNAGYPASTPIMLGEFNSDGCVQSQQLVSIVNALYAGMAFGELLNDGVSIATWFAGATAANYELCSNPASGVYGWQDFGDWDSVAIINPVPNCGSGPTVPDGTVFPAGHAQALRTQFAVPGSTMLRTVVGSGLSNIVAYAATQGTGYALMLFNLDENNTTTVAVALNDATRASFTGTTSTYDKAIYDLSQNNVWNGPSSGSLGTVGSNFSVALSPWSMTVVLLK